jgi:hypothetical protein
MKISLREITCGVSAQGNFSRIPKPYVLVLEMLQELQFPVGSLR